MHLFSVYFVLYIFVCMKKKKILQGIDTIIVRVSDIGKSKKWYEEKLEMACIWFDADMNLAVMDTDSPTSLTLWQTENKICKDEETTTYPIFKVLEADFARESLLNIGVDASKVINDGTVSYFFFYDPDGNRLEACQVHD
jgi:catechol 2,3-dioxygenase-like lactoylglutathione lyase family enzyme